MPKPQDTPPAEIQRETLTTSEGVTTTINPEPAAPAKKETSNAEIPRRPAGEN